MVTFIECWKLFQDYHFILIFLNEIPTSRYLLQKQEDEFTKVLGLNESRLISGTFRAKHVYLPRSTMCGFANGQEIQVLSMIFREYITKNFPSEPRNKIILIRRSESRRFTQQKEIEKLVEAAAK